MSTRFQDFYISITGGEICFVEGLASINRKIPVIINRKQLHKKSFLKDDSFRYHTNINKKKKERVLEPPTVFMNDKNTSTKIFIRTKEEKLQ